MPETQTSTPDAQFIVVDYNGRMAKQKHQRPVAHTYSPRILNLYEDGVPELVLEPGVNIRERSHFERYATEQVDTKKLLQRGEVSELRGLPAHHELVQGDFKAGTGGLICRTRTQSGLDWIEEQAREIQDKEQREEVMEMIGHRRPYANATALEAVPFVDHTPGVAKITAQARA